MAAGVRARRGNRRPCLCSDVSVAGTAVDPETYSRAPYFRPLWRPDILGRSLDSRVDWSDIAKLVTASYCLLAPKKLAAAVRLEKR